MRPFSMRLALAVVPPMSNEMRFARPIWSPRRCAAMTPAAGPDSTAAAGILSVSATSRIPPFEPMTRSTGRSSSARAAARRSRYEASTGPT